MVTPDGDIYFSRKGWGGVNMHSIESIIEEWKACGTLTMGFHEKGTGGVVKPVWVWDDGHGRQIICNIKKEVYSNSMMY